MKRASRDDMADLLLGVLRSAKLPPLTNLGTIANQVVHAGRADGFTFEGNSLSGKDLHLFLDVVWDLCLQGVLRPGCDTYSQAGFPWVTITEYGAAYVRDGQRVPIHNVDAYLTRLRQEVPAADEVIMDYVKEALASFHARSYKAAAVMLGCASEQALLLLMDAYANALQNTSQKTNAEKMLRERNLKTKMDAFRQRVESLGSRVPGDVREDLDIWLSSFSNLMRQYRNDSGHPKKFSISAEVVDANLRCFVPYCKKLYELKAFFDSTPL